MNIFTATSDWRILPPQARYEPPILHLGAQLIVFRAFLMPRLKLIIANFHRANLASLPNRYQVTSCPACCECQASSVQCMHCILARTIQGRLGKNGKIVQYQIVTYQRSKPTSRSVTLSVETSQKISRPDSWSMNQIMQCNTMQFCHAAS